MQSLHGTLLVSIAISILSSELYAASIPSTVQSSIRRRVDYGYNPGIVIGVVDRSGRAFYSYGETILGSEQSPDENTVYEIGSISKVFTTSLLAEMIVNGDVPLEGEVESYLPDGVTVPSRSGVAISLEHLATHASGLPVNPPSIVVNNPLNPFFPFPTAELYTFLNGHRLTRTPGSEFEYSNLGLGLLGHALAQSLGTSFEEALTQRILNPLRLQDTVITASSGLSARRAQGYSGVVERPAFKMEALEAAGQILSTANDMLTFIEHQLGLQQSDLTAAFDLAHEKRADAGAPGQAMGLGWIIITAGSDTIHMHDGATMGHNTFAGFNLKQGIGVVVLSNARINQYAGVQDLGLRSLIPVFPLNSIRRPQTLTQEALAEYPGIYEQANGTSFHLAVQHDHLTFAFSEDQGARFTLYPTRTDRFELYEAALNATATFIRDTDNRIVSMDWKQGETTQRYSLVTSPPVLRISVTLAGIELSLDGSIGDSARIEHSEDLVNWLPFAVTDVGSDPLLVPTGRSQQFFRVP